MTATPKIRKGIPIPEKPRRGPPRKHPIDQLKPGESVRLEVHYNSVIICCNNFVKRYQPKWEFRVVKVEEYVTDVWRVK